LQNGEGIMALQLRIGGRLSHNPNIVYINDQLCHLYGSKVKNKEGKQAIRLIISFNKPDQAQVSYKDRWQIKTAFSAMKSNGSGMEKTHLKNPERAGRRFPLPMIALTRAYLAGIKHNEEVPTKIKKYRRRAKSCFKYGLIHIANALATNNV
jgi:hypothetical protein